MRTIISVVRVNPSLTPLLVVWLHVVVLMVALATMVSQLNAQSRGWKLSASK